MSPKSIISVCYNSLLNCQYPCIRFSRETRQYWPGVKAMTQLVSWRRAMSRRVCPPGCGEGFVMGNESGDENARLSRIETRWSVVRQAHDSDRELATSAKHDLISLYGGAIRSYLGGAVRNDDLAGDLYQDFVVKFLKGDFKNLSPDRGRFRSFVKTVLFRMVAQYFRDQSKAKVVDVDVSAVEKDAYSDKQEEEFVSVWRDEVLNRTWKKLAESEMAGGSKHHTVLLAKVENPLANGDELATIIGEAIGKEISGANARVMVHRSREKFAMLMIEDVSESLDNPVREAVEQELIELGLMEYCRASIDRYKKFADSPL